MCCLWRIAKCVFSLCVLLFVGGCLLCGCCFHPRYAIMCWLLAFCCVVVVLGSFRCLLRVALLVCVVACSLFVFLLLMYVWLKRVDSCLWFVVACVASCLSLVSRFVSMCRVFRVVGWLLFIVCRYIEFCVLLVVYCSVLVTCVLFCSVRC